MKTYVNNGYLEFLVLTLCFTYIPGQRGTEGPLAQQQLHLRQGGGRPWRGPLRKRKPYLDEPLQEQDTPRGRCRACQRTQGQ